MAQQIQLVVILLITFHILQHIILQAIGFSHVLPQTDLLIIPLAQAVKVILLAKHRVWLMFRELKEFLLQIMKVQLPVMALL